jgi:small subunit ribosomal protein SAe
MSEQNLTKREKDILRLLHSGCHVGSRNYNISMKRFIHSINRKGVPTFDLNQTYERILLAARIIAGIEDLSDVYAVSSRDSG